MSSSPLTGVPATPPPERGLGYALMGGLGVTLVTVLLGAAYWFWLFSMQRAVSPAELLPTDTEIYVALSPSLGDLPEGSQVASLLRDQLGVDDSRRVLDGAIHLLGVDYNTSLLTWVGGTLVVAVRGMEAQGAGSAQRLLRKGEVVFLIGSRNDPQAEAFIEKHLAVRAVRGNTMRRISVGQATVYVQNGGAPSPITAFTLFEHYIIFSNRPEAITAMIGRLSSGGDSLAAVPGFVQFSAGLTQPVPGGLYRSGGLVSQTELVALRDLLLNVDR